MDIYAKLNKRAKKAHERILKSGEDYDRRREMERNWIHTKVKQLRNIHLLTIGRGGWTAYRNAYSRIEGHHPDFHIIPVTAPALGIPTIDSRTVPEALLHKLINLPMATLPPREPDAPNHERRYPYGCLSHAPIDYVAAAYKSLGATIYNIDTSAYDDFFEGQTEVA